MPTEIVNIKKDIYDVYIGRQGKGLDGYFGNPFKLQKGEPRGSTIERYKVYFYNRLETDSEFRERVLNLKNKRLGCFCKPHDCHGDVIKEYLDSLKFVVLVCGSRDIKDYNFVFNTLEHLLSNKEKWEVKIINGAQRSYDKHSDTYYGADYFASQYATDAEIECEEFPAPWEGLEDTPNSFMKKNRAGKMYWPGAGMYRNTQMADQFPDACVGFLGKNYKNIGTRAMLNLCKKRGIPTREYYI